MRESGKHVWLLPADWFGGFSAIELDATGTHMTVLSDRGTLAQAQLTRQDGQIAAITLTHRAHLLHRNGNRMLGISADAEGLALAPDGTFYVSFEQRHRIARLFPATGRTTNLARFSESPPFHENNGFEALAIHPDGTIHVMPEKLKRPKGTVPVYQLKGTDWVLRLDLPLAPPFLPVGADFDDEGTLFILERAVTPLGFRSQIRQIAFGAGTPTIRTLLRTSPGQYGNLEGLSVWRDASGQPRLTTISDDNFAPILRTEIVEFVFAE